jgi:hypothetical protein
MEIVEQRFEAVRTGFDSHTHFGLKRACSGKEPGFVGMDAANARLPQHRAVCGGDQRALQIQARTLERFKERRADVYIHVRNLDVQQGIRPYFLAQQFRFFQVNRREDFRAGGRQPKGNIGQFAPCVYRPFCS